MKSLVFLFLTLAPLMAQSNAPAGWLAGAGTAPAFIEPTSRAAWEGRRAPIREQLLKLLGDLPPRPAEPRVTVLSREDRGDYVVEKFEFDNLAGSVVPGYTLLPKSGPEKKPAILYCHWHGGEYTIGKEEIFQARHTPEAPGPAFARRGFVVTAIDACCFGERNGHGPDGEKGGAGELSASKFNLWVGRTLWGMILRDDLMALDYLASRPDVDASRIGVTGMSMGETRTWWLMALDERLKTGVAVACLTRYRDLILHEELRAHGIYYFVPGMLKHFDTETVIALLAPRSVLMMNGDEDAGSPPDGIRTIDAAVKPIYTLYAKSSNYQSRIYPGQGHVYTPPMWGDTLAWFSEKLGGAAGPK